ncbi:MAG: phosphosulfolactate synthase [Bacteroidales bacterium]|jgi:phosphosulfolactate synthase|nr:phosphosulfolactate synthase [Bacteroidales bacterium]
MNFDVPFIPERVAKPRESGLTMMMDKGLSIIEAESFCESSAEFTDLVKFGFGTALITKNLKEKIKLYREAGVEPYFGGTLFEMFVVRNQIDEYRKFVDEYDITTIEISDGSMKIDPDEKVEMINQFTTHKRVLSEVGTKVKGVELSNEDWVKHMKAELEAGAWKVIAEARESGTIGIYNSDGSANRDLIDAIMKEISVDDVLWEAPIKNQQVMFIQMIGANVSLGNIAPNEVVALEALRLGMRGDTFFDSLPEEYQGRRL